MSFPRDPANESYTKVRDLSYDSKLALGLQHLGKFTPDFGAVRGTVVFDSSVAASTNLVYLPVLDKATGEYIVLSPGDQLLSLRVSQLVGFQTPANVTGVQVGIATAYNAAPYRWFTDVASGTYLASNDLIASTRQAFVPVTGAAESYLVAAVNLAVAQTSGEIDVAFLKL